MTQNNLITKVFKLQEDDFPLLVCPFCGGEYTLLEEINPYFDRHDNNRLCVSLTFSCEFGHTFELDFEQHKGMTYPSVFDKTNEEA